MENLALDRPFRPSRAPANPFSGSEAIWRARGTVFGPPPWNNIIKQYINIRVYV